MEQRFKYYFDRRTRRITTAVITIIVAAFAAFSYWGSGSYLPAWFLTIAIAVMALYVLSIPRFIKVDDQSIEIHCLIELTKVHLGDVQSIRMVEPSELKYCFPLLGSYGFFGYYGYYMNLQQWEMVKVYATQWSNFVEITDIYEQKFIISCCNAEQLIELVNTNKEIYIREHEQTNLS